MRKILNVDLISDVGWNAKTSLTEGLNATYRQFCIDAKKSAPLNNLKDKNKVISYP